MLSRIPMQVALVFGVVYAGAAVAEPVVSTIHFAHDEAVPVLHLQSEFFGYQSAIDRDTTDGELAYDYSVHIIRDGARYRMYSGGRWRVSANGPAWDGDHVLQHVSATGAGGTWTMPHNRPEFLQGMEEGIADTWYSNNYLEPEVLKVNGTYYMYTQLQVNPGAPIDIAGQVAETGADRIQLHTSADGDTWTRFSTTRGVVINMAEPTRTALHHQEVIHVPWDEKPWWMYVAVNENDVFKGYFRIRSDDPTRFDYATKQPAGLAQLGNQIGYIQEAPGGPLFLRITFTDNGAGRAVPTLQFSRDGLAWYTPDEGFPLLEGSKDNDRNNNCYFLGLSTVDGTGQLEAVSPGVYRALYGATTSNTPVAPEIFHAEVGVGELVLAFESARVHSADLDADGAIALTELLRTLQLRGAYHCDPTSVDGYAPGDGDREACIEHDADYAAPAWRLGLGEVLRLVQLHHAGGYEACPDADPPTEDGFCLSASVP